MRNSSKISNGVRLINFRLKPIGAFWIILLFGFLLNQAIAQELAKEEIKNRTLIVISASGPAKFTSYWLDSPPRLVIEFQTKNILSKIDDKVIVNQGVIKSLTSSYSGEGQNRFLKSLTFEFTQAVPYKLWQENRTIILDIQVPLETSFLTGQVPLEVPIISIGGKGILAESEAGDVLIKRLEAMDTALKLVTEGQLPKETPEIKITQKPEEGIEELKTEITSPKSVVLPIEAPKTKKSMIDMLIWSIGLALGSGIGILLWLILHRNRRVLDKNIATQEIARLKSELQEKTHLLEQEEVIRKTIENTSIAKEKEFEQLKAELQNKEKLLEQEEAIRKSKEDELLQKEKPELWIPGKSQEKRQSPRLDLSKDYNRTIILRVESMDKSNPSTSLGISPEQSRRAKGIKSFANNISSGGLCFETRKEFKESQTIDLRLFFFGDKVPMMRIKAQIIWKKIIPPVIYYGICFVSLEEKDRIELNRYIESKIDKN